MCIKKAISYKKILSPYLVDIIGNLNKLTSSSRNLSKNLIPSSKPIVVWMAIKIKNSTNHNSKSLSNNCLAPVLKNQISITSGPIYHQAMPHSLSTNSSKVSANNGKNSIAKSRNNTQKMIGNTMIIP